MEAITQARVAALWSKGLHAWSRTSGTRLPYARLFAVSFCDGGVRQVSMYEIDKRENRLLLNGLYAIFSSWMNRGDS